MKSTGRVDLSPFHVNGCIGTALGYRAAEASGFGNTQWLRLL
jgi:hypothetical protein